MKKTVFSIMALCICISLMVPAAYAGDKSTFNFGPKAGVNINYQWGGDIPTLGDTYAGFIAGLFLRIRLLDFLMIQPEVLYSREGSENLHIDYIQIPVLVKLGIPIGSITPNIFGGPVGSFKVWDDAGDLPDNVKATFHDALFSLAFGASCDIDIGSMLLTVEGRWTFSTMDAITTEVGTLSDSMKNGTGAVIVGFGF